MKIVDWMLRRPLIVVVLIVAVSVFFALQIPEIEFDNDIMSFIPDDQPERIDFDELEELYDTDLTIAVAMHVPYGSIFDPATIRTVVEITEKLEAIPNVEDVESLSTFDYIEGTEEGMRSGPLLEDFDGSEASVEELRRRLQSWEIYEGGVVSDDHHSTQIIVGVDPDTVGDERESIYFDIEAVLDEYTDENHEFFIAGEPAIDVLLSRNMQADIATLIPVVIVVVLISLFVFFRRLGGVILPIVTVLLSTVWTIGLMALLGIQLSLVATVIPVLMIAVGSAYGIHIVNHYYDEIDELTECGENLDREVIRAIVTRTLRRVGVPVLTAGLTTVVGFGALMTSRVGPMREFGVFTAVGVGVALIVALTLIPALLLLQRRAAGRCRRRSTEDRQRGFLLGIYRFFAKRRLRFLVFAAIIATIAGWGSSMLIVDNAMIEYFKGDTSIRIADDFLRENFLGTRSFEINVIGEKPGDLTDPEILQAMDDLARHLETSYSEIPRVLSYSDYIKRMNQVMNIGIPSPYGPVVTRPAADAWSSGENDTTSLSPPVMVEDAFTGGFDDGGFSAEGSDGSGFSAEEGFSSSEFNTDDFFGRALTAPATVEAPSVDQSAEVVGASVDPEVAVRALNDAIALSETEEIDGVDLIRLVNRRFNYDGYAYYEVPYYPERYPVETREELKNLIAQYLLLYSGELNNWSDDALEPRQARMTVQLLTTGNQFTKQIVPEIQRYVDARFPDGYEAKISGVAIVERAVTELITNAQILSIAVSLSLVFLIVAITFRSIVAGVFGIVPLGLTILVNFGVMGFFGIKLDVATAMVASIAIGIGIDYTIHFLSAYRHERKRTDNLEEVELRVLAGTGKAITFNAVSVGAGFAVLMFSKFNPLMYLGLLIAVTMFTSSVSSMTVLPVMLDLFRPKFMEPKKGATE